MWPFDRSRDRRQPLLARRLRLDQRPDVIYAIGDVHGCLDELKRLETRIAEDAAGCAGDKLIVMLGDYVDRGPKSAQTLDWLMAPAPAGLRRLCLGGNHEAMLLQALDRPDRVQDWLAWGGEQTLESYGIRPTDFSRASTAARRQMLHTCVPEEHRQFLRDLPLMLECDDLLFVHAGIRPDVSLSAQKPEDLIWIREPFLTRDHGQGVRVIHGHTPSLQPVVLPYRICVDTLAYGEGRLTAARIDADGGLAFLTSEA